MRLLLDTHAFLWWLGDIERLGDARDAIAEASSLVYVSAVSIWEISIKAALGKVDVGSADLVAEIGANDFLDLAVTPRHAQLAGGLPRHHDDPFDRMLVAQAQLEGLTCVTRDPAFAAYDVSVL